MTLRGGSSKRPTFATSAPCGSTRSTTGILFRADIHKLFDNGYLAVAPDFHFLVSRKIKEEFNNGREYYAFHDTPTRLPEILLHRPATDALQWHHEEKFSGVSYVHGAGSSNSLE